MINVDVAAGMYDGGLDEPRQAEAHQDVEDVGADRVRYSHVSIAKKY